LLSSESTISDFARDLSIILSPSEGVKNGPDGSKIIQLPIPKGNDPVDVIIKIARTDSQKQRISDLGEGLESVQINGVLIQ
jgi:hypothetical protein